MPHKAFVSSTYLDLKAHRKYGVDALHNARFSVDPMEAWTATNEEPRELSQDRLDGCDLCILLVAFRRGHVPKGGDLSITQLEYTAALETPMDVLVFLLEEAAAWPRQWDELDKDPGVRQWRA